MQTSQLQKVCERAAKQNWLIKTYSAEGDFAWLWDLPSMDARSKPGEPLRLRPWLARQADARNLLIVGDGIPNVDLNSKPVNISEHLTPFDWALSVSRWILSELIGPSELPPKLRIFIVDNFSGRFPNSYSCRMVDSLLATMPWLWVIRNPSIDYPAARSLANKDDVDWLETVLSRDASDLPTLQGVDRYQARQTIDTLAHAWVGNLTHSTTHHDVNNLLGPLVLAESFATRTAHEDLGRGALLQHARWLGLAPDSRKEDAEITSPAWFDANNFADELGQTVRFVLVDDQANNGWKEVVAAALGLSREAPLREAPADSLAEIAKYGRAELWATTNVDLIVDRLRRVLQDFYEGRGPLDRRFQLHFTDWVSQKERPLEVLLLDLRLVRIQDDEAKYFDAVLDLIDGLDKYYSGRKWPWTTLGDNAPNGKSLKDLRNWIHQYRASFDVAAFRRDATYLKLLTLLAESIATIDLSLPIVLFSSSGQRAITEDVRSFGNIITGFEKPRFVGYRPQDVLQDTAAKWNKSIQQASEILRARLAVQDMRAFQKAFPRPVSSGEKGKYLIQLYIDETGNEFSGEEVTVGGLLVAGPQSKVLEFRGAVEREVNSILKTANGNLKDELRVRSEDLAHCVIEQSRKHHVYAAMVALSADLASGESLEAETGDVENELIADNLYRSVLNAIVEIAVYHAGGEICHESAMASYELYMATRGRQILDRADENYAAALRDRWGIRTVHVGKKRQLWDALDALESLAEEDLGEARKALREFADEKQAADPETYGRKRFIQYLDFDAGRPLAQGLSRQYRLSSFRPKPQQARAFILDPSVGSTRRMHLVADALISARKGGKQSARLSELGFAGDYSLDLRQLLSAARQATSGVIGQGLATGANYARLSNDAPGHDARRRLLGRLSYFAMAMRGIDFIDMVYGLRLARGDAAQSRVQKEGTVHKCRGSLCWIQLIPEGIRLECHLPLRVADQDIWLKRGDHVLVEVATVNEDSASSLEVIRLIRWRRHLRWKDFSVGKKVDGRITAATERGAYVDIGEIDAYVDFKDAPTWRKALPKRGTQLQLKIAQMDSERGILKLAPA